MQEPGSINELQPGFLCNQIWNFPFQSNGCRSLHRMQGLYSWITSLILYWWDIRWISYYISKGWTSVLPESLFSLSQKLSYAGTHVIIWGYWTEAMQEERQATRELFNIVEICFTQKGHWGEFPTFSFICGYPFIIFFLFFKVVSEYPVKPRKYGPESHSEFLLLCKELLYLTWSVLISLHREKKVFIWIAIEIHKVIWGQSLALSPAYL